MVAKVKPWLWLPPQVAHRFGEVALRVYGRFQPLQTLSWRSFVWNDIEFTNRLGLGGGVDKDAQRIQDWWTFGPGFIEIGTVTPKPQTGHSGKVLGRDARHMAVWNKLGFPSRGADFVAARLKALYQPRFTPIFANIGKNKETPLERAHEDYIACMQKLVGLVDAFVVNISSPNTAGLRELLEPKNLRGFLGPIMKEALTNLGRRQADQPTPVLLKISPDMDRQQLEQVLAISVELGVEGYVLTNSSQSLREGLSFPQEGGVSGQPLAATSKQMLKWALEILGPDRQDKLIISAGGVLSPEDVFERLTLGADLVQVYSALIFHGPFFFRQVAEWATVHASKTT